MGSPGVVEVQGSPNGFAGVSDRIVGLEVDLLVFHRPPEAFDEDVVALSVLAIQADTDVPTRQRLNEGVAGQLGALVRIHDLRMSEGRNASSKASAQKSRPGRSRSDGPGQKRLA